MKFKYLFLLLVCVTIISLGCVSAEDNTTGGISQSDSEYDVDIPMNYQQNLNYGEDLYIDGVVVEKTGKKLPNNLISISFTGTAYGEKSGKSEYYEGVSMRFEKNGSFSYVFKPRVAGTLNIYTQYSYYDRYSDSEKIAYSKNQQIYIIPKGTIVTMDSMDDIQLGEDYNITGRLTDSDGKPLRYTGVGVILNGTQYGDSKNIYSKEYTRTDWNGYYTYTISPIAGNYNVEVYYPGYHNYRFNTTKNTIKLQPIETVITMTDENEINVDSENVTTVTGRLTTIDGKPLRYTGVGVLFNGRIISDETSANGKTYIRTDEDGYFNFTVGTDFRLNNYTFYYPGYHNYNYSFICVTIINDNNKFDGELIPHKYNYYNHYNVSYGNTYFGIGGVIKFYENITFRLNEFDYYYYTLIVYRPNKNYSNIVNISCIRYDSLKDLKDDNQKVHTNIVFKYRNSTDEYELDIRENITEYPFGYYDIYFDYRTMNMSYYDENNNLLTVKIKGPIAIARFQFIKDKEGVHYFDSINYNTS